MRLYLSGTLTVLVPLGVLSGTLTVLRPGGGPRDPSARRDGPLAGHVPRAVLCVGAHAPTCAAWSLAHEHATTAQTTARKLDCESRCMAVARNCGTSVEYKGMKVSN